MATWTDPATINTNPKDPITSEFGTAALENVEAAAEGASGAPTWEVAWHYVETQEPETDPTNIVFSTDLSTYRAFLLEGAAVSDGSGGLTFNVDIRVASTWRTIDSISLTGTEAAILRVYVSELDNDASDDFGVVQLDHCILSDMDRSEDGPTTAGAETKQLGYYARSGSVDAVRLNASLGAFEGTDADRRTILRLYGIKRTLA